MITADEARKIFKENRSIIDEGVDRYVTTTILPAISLLIEDRARAGDGGITLTNDWLTFRCGAFGLLDIIQSVLRLLKAQGFKVVEPYSACDWAVLITWDNK